MQRRNRDYYTADSPNPDDFPAREISRRNTARRVCPTHNRASNEQTVIRSPRRRHPDPFHGASSRSELPLNTAADAARGFHG